MNEYLKSIYKYLSAKVFRTYNASITLQEQLKLSKINEDDEVEKKVDFYNDANRKVAVLCNHQKTVSKGFANQSSLLDGQLKEHLKYLEELKDHVNSLKSKKKINSSKKDDEDVDENDKTKIKKVFPDNISKAETLIKNIDSKIEKLQKKIKMREDNKDIALNTSKLNYMDPRITISWCKNNEVPIEKVFPRSVRDKFPWAMYTDPNFEF